MEVSFMNCKLHEQAENKTIAFVSKTCHVGGLISVGAVQNISILQLAFLF